MLRPDTFLVFAYLRLCDAHTQSPWLWRICVLVNVFGKREETGSHMNADTLTIKKLSFRSWTFFKLTSLFFFFPGNVLKPLSPTEPAPPVLKGTDGSLYASNLQELCRRIRHLHFFGNPTSAASTLGKPISGLPGEPAGKRSKKTADPSQNHN